VDDFVDGGCPPSSKGSTNCRRQITLDCSSGGSCPRSVISSSQPPHSR
jgi:hypothetical protein